MTRWFALVLLATLNTGCYTSVRAPGATGLVIDARTRVPIQGVRVTRPAEAGGQYLSPESLPALTVVSDKKGRFDLPPILHTQIAFMYSPNPYSITGSFRVSAEGYLTNDLHGAASRRTSWRVELGQITLKKE